LRSRPRRVAACHQGAGEWLDAINPVRQEASAPRLRNLVFPTRDLLEPALRKRVGRANGSCFPSSPGRDRHTQLWLPFLPCLLRCLVTHDAAHHAILKSGQGDPNQGVKLLTQLSGVPEVGCRVEIDKYRWHVDSGRYSALIPALTALTTHQM